MDEDQETAAEQQERAERREQLKKRTQATLEKHKNTLEKFKKRQKVGTIDAAEANRVNQAYQLLERIARCLYYTFPESKFLSDFVDHAKDTEKVKFAKYELSTFKDNMEFILVNYMTYINDPHIIFEIQSAFFYEKSNDLDRLPNAHLNVPGVIQILIGFLVRLIRYAPKLTEEKKVPFLDFFAEMYIAVDESLKSFHTVVEYLVTLYHQYLIDTIEPRLIPVDAFPRDYKFSIVELILARTVFTSDLRLFDPNVSTILPLIKEYKPEAERIFQAKIDSDEYRIMSDGPLIIEGEIRTYLTNNWFELVSLLAHKAVSDPTELQTQIMNLFLDDVNKDNSLIEIKKEYSDDSLNFSNCLIYTAQLWNVPFTLPASKLYMHYLRMQHIIVCQMREYKRILRIAIKGQRIGEDLEKAYNRFQSLLDLY